MLARCGGVFLRIILAMLLYVLVLQLLLQLAYAILPGAWSYVIAWWALLILFGGVDLFGGFDEPWSWVQIPESVALLATFAALAAVGWVVQRIGQGLPVRFGRWEPKLPATKLTVLLALIGTIYPVVLSAPTYFRWRDESLAEALWYAAGTFLSYIVLAFFAGGVLAMLSAARKSEWWASALGAVGLVLGHYALHMWLGWEQPAGSCVPKLVVAAILLLGAAVALRRALNEATTEASSGSAADIN